MLPQVILAAFLGSQLVTGYVVLRERTVLIEPQRFSYVDCGLSSDIIQVKEITINPDPPKAGEDLEVTAKVSVRELLEEGAYADVAVKIGVIKILQKRFDVCEEARQANATVQCPVEPGDYTIVQTVALPKEIPPAKYLIEVRAYSVEEDDVVCLNLKLDFTPAVKIRL